MKQARTIITNRLGLHARAATLLVNCTSGFTSEIWISLGDRRINGKSIMGVLTLAAARGSELLIEAEGEDEEEAVAAVVRLIENKFNEEA